jgi:hypothetical protein
MTSLVVYFLVHSQAVASKTSLRVENWWAVSGIKGFLTLGSSSNEDIEVRVDSKESP